MSRILITNPAHDETTQILSAWIESVAVYIKGPLATHSHDLIRLNSDEVTKDNLTRHFDEHSPQFMMINGHGAPNALFGHNNEPIIEVGDPENTRYSSNPIIIHALACAAAKDLGVELTNGSSSTFIGYREDFHFYHSGASSDPLNDPLARLFLEPAYHVPKEIAAGKTAQEAFENAQKLYAANFKFALASNIPNTILASLMHDARNHTILGNSVAALST